VERMAIVYGNVGFMGMPLMSAMFGIDAIFYLSAINLVYVF
jgi:predicted permease